MDPARDLFGKFVSRNVPNIPKSDHTYSLSTADISCEKCESYRDDKGDSDDGWDWMESDSERGRSGDDENEEVPASKILSWDVGRRVVELGVLSEGLQKGCFACHNELRLQNIVLECHYGLASVLSIRCDSCFKITRVPTGKRHEKGRWDVNTKLGAAVTHCGIGPTVVNRFLACLNIPSIDSKTLKRREREAGVAVESVAKQSCDNAIKAEKEACESKSVSKSVSYDAGWQKRGAGRSYDSKSGHGSMIGVQTDKILSFAVRCKSCRTCAAGEKDGITVSKEHDCRKNWSGSSKAMEPDMAVSMLHQLHDKDFHVQSLFMDNDTTTLHRARTSFDRDITKASDFNHTKKNLINKLYELKKEKNYKALGPKTIKHLQRCFMYVVKSNKENEDEIRKGLLAITPHVFGDHLFCDVSWCKYLQDPSSYVPKNLPYVKYLENLELKTDLQSIFNRYATMSDQLCKLGSTQSNESFNRMVAARNPKSIHYSGSESTSYRVASAAAHKNEGNETILKVNEELMLSPGICTELHVQKSDKKRKAQKERQNTVSFKKRRSQAKSSNMLDSAAHEVREGTTYQSSIDIEGDHGKDDIDEIPNPVEKPVCEPLVKGKYTFVYFDLETTGLGSHSQIVQLSATKGDNTFNAFVKPDVQIHPKATEATGFHITGGKLYRNSDILNTVSLSACLKQFGEWLKSFSSSVVLLAHNAKGFDSLILSRAIVISDCQILRDVVKGFVDTLCLFREIFPERTSHQQVSLVKDILGQDYQAHCAIEDAKSLQNLVNSQNLSCDKLLEHSFSLSYTLDKLSHNDMKQTCLKSLTPFQNILSSYMMTKISESGLEFRHFKLAFSRGGEEGVTNICKEQTRSGKVRVTNDKKIIRKLVSYLESLK